jgi:hypothetical protein
MNCHNEYYKRDSGYKEFHQMRVAPYAPLDEKLVELAMVSDVVVTDCELLAQVHVSDYDWL